MEISLSNKLRSHIPSFQNNPFVVGVRNEFDNIEKGQGYPSGTVEGLSLAFSQVIEGLLDLEFTEDERGKDALIEKMYHIFLLASALVQKDMPRKVKKIVATSKSGRKMVEYRDQVLGFLLDHAIQSVKPVEKPEKKVHVVERNHWGISRRLGTYTE